MVARAPLWHNRNEHPLAFGCLDCVLRPSCGGLNIPDGPYSCDDFCCHNPATCTSVCPSNPVDLVAHLSQVGGFPLGSLPRVPTRRAKPPLVVPMVYGGSARRRPLPVSWVAVPLARLYDRRSGRPKYATRAEFAEAFKIDAEAQIVVSGTDEDAVIERWWQLPSRAEILESLAVLGVTMLTAPNYSLFTAVPRTDNLYNAKRIGVAWTEIATAGIPAALHLNARTDDDYRRWTDFVGERPEVAHVAFEFGTGAGHRRRTAWHAEQLAALAHAVDRPLHLSVRGGEAVAHTLHCAYAEFTFIDTTAYVKTIKRQIPAPSGAYGEWSQFPTDPSEDLTDLLAHNIDMRISELEALIVGYESARSAPGTEHVTDTTKPGVAARWAITARARDGFFPEISNT